MTLDTGRPVRRDAPVRRRPSQRRFWLRRTVVAAILLAIVGVIWLGVSAFRARGALMRAQAGTVALREDLQREDGAKAAQRLSTVRADTRKAVTLTSSLPWKVAGRLPIAGRTVRTVRGLAREADTLSTRVLPHFAAIGSKTSGGALRDGDKVDIAALRAMHDELTLVVPELEAVTRRSRSLPDSLLLIPVAKARRALVTDTEELTRTTTQLRDATGIAPSMLGADGTRRYFVAFQTNAEMRGSGGLLGGFAILEADQGKLRMTKLGPNKELRDTYPAKTPGLESAFEQRYAAYGADGFWLNSNMSAHFPTVSTIWSSMYERTTGTRIDGSIAVDPVAMAAILKSTGPATAPGGEEVTADNVVALTEEQIYARYPKFEQDSLRDKLQLEIARSLYERFIAPVSHEVGLLPQLGSAATGGHVRMASNHPREQAVLAGSPIGGALPATDGPYLQVAFNNAGGTKLDYYLKSAVRYSFEEARGDSQDVSASITLRSDAPAAGLPDYVVIRPDLPGNRAVTPGQNRLHVSVYAGRGASLRGASIDGSPVHLEEGAEQGHPVWSTFVTLDPGQEKKLVLALTEPGIEQEVTVVSPPTMTPSTVEILGGVAR